MGWYQQAAGRLWITDWSETAARAAPVFVLLHGAGMDHSVWALVGRALAAAGFRVLAPDLPGHGRSGGTPPPSIEDHAAALAEVLAGLAVTRPLLVGHSMGSLIALELAPRTHAAGLALVAASARMAVHPRLLQLAARDAAAAAELMVRWSFPAEVRFGGQPIPGTWLPAAARTLIARSGPQVLAADLTACDTYQGAAARARALDVPARVVAGARDRMTPPRAGRELAGLLPRGRFLLLEGCGHMIPLERPAALVQALLALAAEAASPAAAGC